MSKRRALQNNKSISQHSQLQKQRDFPFPSNYAKYVGAIKHHTAQTHQPVTLDGRLTFHTINRYGIMRQNSHVTVKKPFA
jgi:hypothetical protein